MTLVLRVVCIEPPPERTPDGQPTVFGLQHRDGRLQAGTPRPDLGERSLQFTCEVTISDPANFRGSTVFGTPKNRFLYLAYALEGYDSSNPAWIRRRKIPLTSSLPDDLIEAAQRAGQPLEIHVDALTASRTKAVWQSV